MKVKLDFCDFWPGFSKTDNFFYRLLQKRFEIELCDGPDFLIYGDALQHLHRVHNCVKIFFNPESSLPDFRQCDYALTCHYLDDPRHFRLPYYALCANPVRLIKKEEDWAAQLRARTKFCAFVVSNVHARRTSERIEFFHRLSQYKKVDSAGRALNNTGFILPPGADLKQQFLRDYKFNIAYENASVPGYTTEKIIDAMQARCLPIYWGDPRIGEEFNPRSFLNRADFPSDDALVEKIIELDQDDAKYLAYMREPYLPNNQPNACLNLDRLLDKFEEIFSARLRPVSARRKWWQVGRWMVVKKQKAPG